MKIKTITLKGRLIWLVVDSLRIYSKDQKKIATTGEHLCYFKLTEPTPFFYGELFRNKNRKPMLFKTET